MPILPMLLMLTPMLMMLAPTLLLLSDEFKAAAYVDADDVDAETKMLNASRHLAEANVVVLLLLLLVVMRVMPKFCELFLIAKCLCLQELKSN
jgi:hypothetical protein